MATRRASSPLKLRMAWLVCAALTTTVLALCGGCGRSEQRDQNATLLIGLIDETGSFGKYWQPSLEVLAGVVDHLRPGDRVCLIAIDNHGFDSDDVRLPVVQIPKTSLLAHKTRRDLRKSILALQPRQMAEQNASASAGRRGTDIVGALSQAANCVAYIPDIRPVVLVFSDMIEDPANVPSGAPERGLQFPTATRLAALFVWQGDSRGGATEWEHRVSHWVSTLRHAGVDCAPHDFLPPELSNSERAVAMLSQ